MMRKMNRKKAWLAMGMLMAFGLWTVLLRFVDVQPIGPHGSNVGMAAWNIAVHRLLGVHMPLYTVTDWLSLIPVAVVLGFGFLGWIQWIRRKRLGAVDRSILLLGGFYAAVAAVYLFFETVVVNYRPILINGSLEASYPSSTTVLVLCVMLTALKQLHMRMPRTVLRRIISCLLIGYVVFMVAGRLLSGVHWVTDIIGGGLLSAGLVMLYDALCGYAE